MHRHPVGPSNQMAIGAMGARWPFRRRIIEEVTVLRNQAPHDLPIQHVGPTRRTNLAPWRLRTKLSKRQPAVAGDWLRHAARRTANLPIELERAGADIGERSGTSMPTSLTNAVHSYLRSGSLARGTRNEYGTTLRKWREWGGGVAIERLGRREIREFLDWVYERAIEQDGTNPGRTSNKAREHLRAVISWAWEQDLIEAPPRFPKPRAQRDVAGRHYLTKAEMNALYFATYSMRRPRGWKSQMPVGRNWRAALVLFFNYGVDTGTICRSVPWHEPLLWRHVSWESNLPIVK